MKIFRKYLTEDKKAVLTGYLFEKIENTGKRKPWTPEKRPAMLILPGGSYMYCSPREGEPIALTFAQEAYQTFVLEYHCGEDSDYPRPLEDVILALDYIKKNADEFSVDTKEIVLTGFSAGGHLALLYGSSFFRPEFQDLVNRKEEELEVHKIIAGYPVAYLKELQDLIVKYDIKIDTGKMLYSDEKRRDPYELIDPRMPKTFIFTTLEDKTVPAHGTVEYVRKMVEKSCDVEFHLFNKGQHGLSTGDDLANYGRDYPKRIHKWVDLAKAWLKEE